MTRRTRRVRPEDLSAYVDGELSAERAAEVTEAVRKDPSLLARLDAYREQTKNLHALYDPVLRAPIPDRLSDIALWLGRNRTAKES